ncbi:hypothetical protein Vqi01_24280 [Micromonospora qiuiae]|uniref:Uncharacterized protein n=1 Tax=Micromonospora qiuiae TaxID=502268 RepID=A0ABQ4JAS6_9ACTN|nr:hypothetical protein Vqi01_24280 [Micromonospora qiuiae]
MVPGGAGVVPGGGRGGAGVVLGGTGVVSLGSGRSPSSVLPPEARWPWRTRISAEGVMAQTDQLDRHRKRQ